MVKTRKLPMQFRESKEKRQVTFTKRRKGLFSKAAELCMLCDAQVAILVTSPCSKHKVFSFGPTSIDAILESFLHKRVPENMDDGTKRLALSLSTEIKALDTELNRIILNKNKATAVSSVSETCPWMNIVEFEESVEGIRALIESLEKLKAKAEKRLGNSSFHKFPTTTTTFATSKNTHNHINPYYDHGSSSMYEQQGRLEIPYGHDSAGYYRPLCSFNGQDNIDSSHYNGSNFPLGGDMNGFGNETNMVSCDKNSWNLPKSEYNSYYNGLHNGNEDTNISSNGQFLNSSFMNKFLGEPFSDSNQFSDSSLMFCGASNFANFT